MDTDKIVFGVIAAITIGVLGFIFVSSFKSAKPVSPVGLIGVNPHYKGANPSSAKLVIVEFSDFECPFCAKYSPTLNILVKRYKGQLSVVYRHFPLRSHVGAIPAAKASEAAALQGKFWEYHDELFANQSNYGKEDLARYAKNVGLDIAKFEKDITSSSVTNAVSEDSDLASQLKLSSTPTFFFVFEGKAEKLNLQSSSDVEAKVEELLGPVSDGQVPSSGTSADNNNYSNEVQAVLDKIAYDLVIKQGLAVDSDGAEVVSVEEMTWPNSSLGCPKEGVNYTDVITPGYKIVVNGQGNTYEYHADMDETLILCD